MRFAVLAAADSWYARDLARAAAGDYEIVTLPFSEIVGRVSNPSSPHSSLSRRDHAALAGMDAGAKPGLQIISAGRDLTEEEWRTYLGVLGDRKSTCGFDSPE